MFNNLQDTIKALNADVKNVANCEHVNGIKSEYCAKCGTKLK